MAWGVGEAGAARCNVAHNRRGEGPHCRADCGGDYGRRAVPPSMTHSSAPTGAVRGTQATARSDPSPAVRADLAALPPLPRRTRTPWVAECRSLSASASASLIRRPARHSNTMSVRVRKPYSVLPAQRMMATPTRALVIGRGSQGRVARRTAATMTRQRRGWANDGRLRSAGRKRS